MQDFTNETIDTTQLPKFEAVQFTALHKDYWKVTLVYIGILVTLLSVFVGLMLAFNEELAGNEIPFVAGAVLVIVLIVVFSRIGFVKKGFAFREHDVLFRSGIIATNTIVIPYNRVQHVALHEGLIPRYFGLATVEVFTAGGKDSDIEIPGIEKEQAENIKLLLMGKIQKQL